MLVGITTSHTSNIYYSKLNKSFTFTSKLSAKALSFVTVVSLIANSRWLIICLEIPLKPTSSCVSPFSFLIFLI